MRQRLSILWEPQNAVDHDGIGDVFELLHADLADGEESDDTSCRLRANEDRPASLKAAIRAATFVTCPGRCRSSVYHGLLQFGGADNARPELMPM